MTSLLSESLTSSIQEQIAHEMHNANLYLYICGYLRNKGLGNLAKHFENQWKEENEHAKMFFDFLTDMNADVRIPEVAECNLAFVNIDEVARAYLSREIFTTESINSIRLLAMEGEDANPVAEEFLRKMVSLQQHEYAEASDFTDKAELIGGDWKFVLLWDQALGD